MTDARPTWLNLATLLRIWDASLTPPSVAPRAANRDSGPPRRTGRAETRTPLAQRVIEARTTAIDSLTAAVMTAREQIHGPWPAPPERLGIRERVAMLEPHADWLDTTHPGLAATIDAAVSQLEDIVYPDRSDRQRIGYCPRAVDAEDGHGQVTCGGPVDAYPDPPDALGRVHYTSAQCRWCRCDAVLPWWADQLQATAYKTLVTTRELVSVLAFEVGLATSTSTIRTWVSRGILQVAGRGERGAVLFNRADAIATLRARHIAA